MPTVATGPQSRRRRAHSKSRGGCLECKRRHSKVRMKHMRARTEAVVTSVLTLQQPYSATRFVRPVAIVGAWAMVVTTSQSSKIYAPAPKHKTPRYRNRQLIRIHLCRFLLTQIGCLLQCHQLVRGMRRRPPRGLVKPQPRPPRVSPHSP
jgi:hypothetical protein